jgi:hypothetical protein
LLRLCDSVSELYASLAQKPELLLDPLLRLLQLLLQLLDPEQGARFELGVDKAGSKAVALWVECLGAALAKGAQAIGRRKPSLARRVHGLA